MVKKDQLCAIALMIAKTNKIKFDDVTQNGFYGRQPQHCEAVFYSIDANTSCSFKLIKQDSTDKQAYRVSFSFDS